MKQLDPPSREFVLSIIGRAHDLTLATVRPDGYPQATTVSYAHDGLTLYVGVGLDSQKARNIQLNNKVSLTINTAYADWDHIQGLSIGATAEILHDRDAMQHAADCLLKRFPQIKTLLAGTETMPWQGGLFLKITPQVISILDYTKGFGHTELMSA